MRRKTLAKKRTDTERKQWKIHQESFKLSITQVSVISKGLQFIPTDVMDENKIRRFRVFCKMYMCLHYIFDTENSKTSSGNRNHQMENTRSIFFTEVKPCWTGLLSGWVTIWIKYYVLYFLGSQAGVVNINHAFHLYYKC